MQSRLNETAYQSRVLHRALNTKRAVLRLWLRAAVLDQMLIGASARNPNLANFSASGQRFDRSLSSCGKDALV